MARYGVPYQGSKSKLADWIVDLLPAGEILIDLMAGGCAVTHAALLSDKWGKVIANDIGKAPDLFFRAAKGEYRGEKRWISREDFARLKEEDEYVRLCWSFGNNGTGYLYSKEIEPWKKAVHFARVLGDNRLLLEMGIDSDGSRADIKAHHEEYKNQYIRWWLSRQNCSEEQLNELIRNVKEQIEKDEEELRGYLRKALKESGLTQAEVQRRLGTQMARHYFGRSQWEFPTEEMYKRMQEFMPLPEDYNQIIGLYRLRQRLQRLQSMQSLEGLESLESLERLKNLGSLGRLQSLEMFRKDYREVTIPAGAVVYIDPPYRGTNCGCYGDGFDFAAFDAWVQAQDFPVFTLEYTAPEGCAAIAERPHRSTFGAGSNHKTIEKIFIQKKFLSWWEEQKKG